MTRPHALRRGARLLAEAAALTLVYRTVSGRTARRRLRRAQQRWAPVVAAGRRPSALGAGGPASGPYGEPATGAPDGLSTATSPGQLRGAPRLYLPVGGKWQISQVDAGTDIGQRVVRLALGRLVLGSGQDADLRVDDSAVAAAHAEVVSDSQRVQLRDLVGTGVVLVDGVPVLDADLVDGNRLSVAGHDLVFRRDADPRSGRSGGEGS